METALPKRGWAFWRWPVVIAAGVAVAGAAVPLLVPVSSFIPTITRIAQEKIGQPVRLADLRLHLFPTPRVLATGLEVGKRGEVSIEEVEIVPDVLSFISGPRSIRLVHASGVKVKQAALAIPDGLPKSEGGGDAILVRRIRLDKVEYQQPGMKIPPFNLDVELGEALALKGAKLEMRDVSLNIAVEPESPKVAKYVIGGRAFGGTVNAVARADSTRQVQLTGKAAVSGMELLPVQALLGKPAQFSGRLKTDATFSARARTADRLADALSLDAPFEIQGGTYYGYDLSKVGGFSGKLDKGGSTRFDELKGTVQVRGKVVKITDLCARSPKLVAGGHVDIGAQQELSGKLDVSVAQTGGFVGIPVNLKGTTADPWFMPSKGYLIGAAVGTVLMPGIGTSIGSSVGSRIEGSSDCK